MGQTVYLPGSLWLDRFIAGLLIIYSYPETGLQFIQDLLPIDDDIDQKEDRRCDSERKGDPVGIRDQKNGEETEHEDGHDMSVLAVIDGVVGDGHDSQDAEGDDRDDSLCPAGSQEAVDQDQQDHDVEVGSGDMGEQGEFH